MTDIMGEYVATREKAVEDAEPKSSIREYTEEEITLGLGALIAFGGAPGPAHRALKATGHIIPVDRLRAWKEHVYVDRYVKLQTEHAQDIEAALVREIRDLARTAAMAERIAVERTLEALSDPKSRIDAGQAAIAMTKVKQTNIDKLLALTGRPQQITEHRSVNDIVRALEAKGVVELEAP